MSFETEYLTDVRVQFQKVKELCDRAVAQVGDHELTAAIDEESNSIAVVMKHMAGNLRSRFTDFLTTDGEKPDRNRDGEFVIDASTPRAAILERWEEGWRTIFSALDSLTPADLPREVTVRGERMPVVSALNRALSHQAYHAGQVVFLAKHFRAADWKSLSIPRRP